MVCFSGGNPTAYADETRRRLSAFDTSSFLKASLSGHVAPIFTKGNLSAIKTNNRVITVSYT